MLSRVGTFIALKYGTYRTKTVVTKINGFSDTPYIYKYVCRNQMKLIMGIYGALNFV